MEAGDVVVLEVTMEGTQATDFLGIVNQEKHVDVDQAWMVWVREGRVRGLRAYWCQNQLYRRLAVKRLDRVSILELAR
jgi:ketosteroid isomerase-like protein